MATRNRTSAKKSSKRLDEFYEAMPLAKGMPYRDDAYYTDEEAPDHDFAALEDEGRAVAIKTLVFVAIVTILVCALLIWGAQTAREVFQPAAGNTLGL